MSEATYWRPEPKRHSVAWWALLIPAVVYSVGVIVYAHAAFSPADIADNGHAVGSALMPLRARMRSTGPAPGPGAFERMVKEFEQKAIEPEREQ